MTHTPGPWTAHTNNNTDYIDIDDARRERVTSVCLVETDENGDEYISQGDTEKKANARLIASAPDLLEVVEAMANFDGRNNNSHLKEMARAAIAKATQ